jgi:hypothetical protein
LKLHGVRDAFDLLDQNTLQEFLTDPVKVKKHSFGLIGLNV